MALAAKAMADSGVAVQSLWIAPDCAPLFARHGLRTLDDLFAVQPAQRLDKATLPAWRKRLMLALDDGQGQTHRFFVKRYAPPRGGRRRRVGPGQSVQSTAGVERHWVLTLGAAGLPVPRLAAFGEELAGGRERRSVLVLHDVGGESLERWADRVRRPAPRALVAAVADLIRGLHERRFIHRDLYLAHIFLTNGDAHHPELCLIDLQRVLHAPWRWGRWRARELAQLDYSTPAAVAGRTARLFFLKRYLGCGRLSSRRTRALLRRIARKREGIAAHDARARARGAEGSVAR